jgi:hypothetical protein
MDEGDYEGLPFVGVKATNFEKGQCITLKNVYLEHGDARFHRIPDNVDDEWSIYKLLHHHLDVFCPPNIGRIFRHRAFKKELNVSDPLIPSAVPSFSPRWSPFLLWSSAVPSLFPALVPVPLALEAARFIL